MESSRPRSLQRLARRLVGRAWLAAFGWRIEGGAPAARKAVVIAAPHTSNWDLPFSIAVSFALDLDMSWIGKHTLFRVPFGSIMRALGGVAVDRRARHNAVTGIAALIDEAEELLLIIPPEGTRGRATRWKTGFYYIAVEAKVPIVLGFLDYERKCGGLGELFWPTGDIRADFERIRVFYEDIKGKYPERSGSVTLGDDESARVPDPPSSASVVG